MWSHCDPASDHLWHDTHFFHAHWTAVEYRNWSSKSPYSAWIIQDSFKTQVRLARVKLCFVLEHQQSTITGLSGRSTSCLKANKKGFFFCSKDKKNFSTQKIFWIKRRSVTEVPSRTFLGSLLAESLRRKSLLVAMSLESLHFTAPTCAKQLTRQTIFIMLDWLCYNRCSKEKTTLFC